MKRKCKFGKWYPLNPYPNLEKGRKIIGYVFTKEVFDKLGEEGVKRTLDDRGFQHPSFVRTNKLCGNTFIEFICVNPKEN